MDGTLKKVEIPFEIPESWKWVRLNSVVSILGDGLHGTPNYSNNGDCYFINGNNLENGEINIKGNTKTVLPTEHQKYKKPLNEQSVLVSINGTLGNVAFYKNENVILGKSACYFNLISINQLFIKTIIDSNYFHTYAHNQATGSTIKNLSLDAMHELLLPLPSLPEQQRIVSVIESVFAVINDIEENKLSLEQIVKQAKSKVLDLAIRGKLVPQNPNDEPASILLERIKNEQKKAGKKVENGSHISHYKPFEIPESWVWVKGAKCFNPMESKKPIGETFGYIDINSIDNKTHKITEPKYLNAANAPSRANRGVEVGDTLFSMVRPYLENIAYIETKYSNCIASTGFFVCRPTKVLYPKYLYYLMLSSYVIDGLNSFMKGDNSPSINNENIISYVFPLPPLPEQHRIVSQIETIFNQLDAIEHSIKA